MSTQPQTRVMRSNGGRTTPLRVCGVDPGYGRLGVAFMERMGGKERLLASMCIETEPSLPHEARLATIDAALRDMLAKYRPTVLGIESLFFNRNQKTAVGVAEARGVVLSAAAAHGLSVCELSPQEIKVAITGYGKSDKAAVISMVRRLIAGAPERAHDDEYDAIAVALTCLLHHISAVE